MKMLFLLLLLFLLMLGVLERFSDTKKVMMRGSEIALTSLRII
ncbi:hypothetical protein [Pontibacter beigongshangensis]|nr:hypothetical protein [Pontibacter beigongshangensis]